MGRGKRGKKGKKTEEALSAGEMDEDEDEIEEIVKLKKDSLMKHKEIHESRSFLNEQAQKLYEKMKFYLDCDFNLFLYGVGTKKNFLNSFVLS